ncbi:MAG: hypothetical protein JXR95_15100 [Deltaproteobacteria bacterium]|nr:hypothetical protein [Deltaproteobacteria bacterium]
MHGRRKHTQGARVFAGVAFITVGVLFLLKNMGLLGNFELWRFWPVVLILAGIGNLGRPFDFKKIIHFIFFTGTGTVLLLKNIGIIVITYRQLWPFILIFGGIAIVIHTVFGKSAKNISEASVDFNVVMGGGEFQNNSKELSGGKISVIMGGVELDLRKSEMMGNEITIDVFAMWGGISMRVPEEWDVNMDGSPLLGGMENKTRFAGTKKSEKNKILNITGMVIMGGVEVKN